MQQHPAPVSIRVTGIPALAKHMAMPPPIVPAPITAARAIGRGFVSGGHVRHLRRLALGKEDVALRLRLIAGDELLEQLALAPQPFVERQDDGVAHRLDAGGRRLAAAQPPGQGRRGIGKRPRPMQLVVAVADEPQRPALGDGPAGKGDRRRVRSPVERSRRRCRRRALAPPPTGSPVTIIRNAFSGPTRRGRRWVPPAPGNRPSLTSGRPTRAAAAATRKWQASASSKPPPNAVPCKRRDHRLWPSPRSAAMTSPRLGARGGLPNSLMSAPAKKVRPAQAITTASTRRVVAGLAQRLDKPGADLVLQRVDRRIVGDDDRDPAVAAKIDAGVDVAHAAPAFGSLVDAD